MFWSTFTAHFNANKRSMPKAVAESIRLDAIARYMERMRAGRADCALDFSDLVARIENAIAGQIRA